MSIYDTLNDKQKEAVLCTEGPLLILAGAGSGKTRVLTHRIAYLIEECGVNPWNILAITFTNKAAGEMRERVDKIVGFGSDSVWVSTFHSTCVRILRRHIDLLGYDTNFTIYDTDDQKSVMKEVIRSLELDPKIYKERTFLGVISHAKDELISPEEFLLNAGLDYKQQLYGRAYREYQAALKKNNALDFDDLIVKTVELFRSHPEVLEYYQERFKYIMVDEYQDTNTAQFKFVSLLAQKYQNLCVVGDDDQSIYKFRGANIGNILNFEKVFPDARVIKLEQNYRSTGNILNAANAVISNNIGRKDKKLWTEAEEGDGIYFRQFYNGYEEAEYVAEQIRKSVRQADSRYQDHAVLYRTNAQSRLFEEQFIRDNIPYRLIGGVNFYARKEIKDLLSYLKTIDNGVDDLAVKRIINVPKRGIGLTTLDKVQRFANDHEMSFFEVLENADGIPELGRSASKLKNFSLLIQSFRAKAEELSLTELMEDILEVTGYRRELELEGTDEADARIENIDELISKVTSYEENCIDEPPTLSGFLEEVALVADIDNLDEDENRVLLMTLHSAKGLEFPYVYLAGMEDGIFPSYMSIAADNPREEIEEERRLCYVGITRAMKKLTMTAAKMRMIRGENQFNAVSRFMKEIPADYLERGCEVRKEKTIEMPKNDSWREMKRTFREKPKAVQQFTVTKASSLEYGIGDRVRHMKFGEGTVADITEGGRDYEVAVDFDNFGRKKMFASFAKLKKV
ncbi:MAG: DNA helicase PcrA [Lachnospiraceae bacterium]|nr:DNA helicase PcrA [Lachnospiraceae bacterium]